MPKYIIQKHEKQGEPVHWDLMLEHDDILKTFRIDRPPERWNDEVAQAIPIFDHEKRFLTYEGPVNKGLGHVEIVERGEFETLSQTATDWLMRLFGKTLNGIFELHMEPGRHGTLRKGAQPEDWVEITVCRGLERKCRCSLVDELGVVEELRHAVRDSSLVKHLMGHTHTKPTHHKRLRIAVAACPNACSMPQIKAIGLIARHKPTHIEPGCNLCEACVRRCQEEAFRVAADQVVFEPSRCVGCGQCLNACSQDLIKADDLAFEVLVGGILGRHPRLARSLGTVQPHHVAPAITRILDFLLEKMRDGSSIPKTLRGIDSETWQRHIDLSDL